MLILIAHIVLALSSLLLATIALFKGTTILMKLNLVLITSVVISGVGLVVIKGAPILHTCLSGVVYLFVVLGLLALANKKLIEVKSNAK